MRLDAALAAHVPGLSRAASQRLVREGIVSVNGMVTRRSARSLAEGDRVSVRLPGPTSKRSPVAPSIQLTIVFEDDHILIVDKPAGVATHPGSGRANGTLVDVVLTLRPGIAAIGQPDRPGVVHRLDLDTSGLIIFAKTPEAYEGLSRMIRAHEVKRTYLALVEGRPSLSEGVIEAPVGRHPVKRTMQAVVESGKPARTRYASIMEFKAATLLEVSPETGRMHQIRVHMSALGHPVLGDRVYGRGTAALSGLARQFLHAARLSFRHPVTGGPVDVSSELPDDLKSALLAAQSV